MVWMVKATPRPINSWESNPKPVVQENPELVLTGVENLASTGIRSPERPARNGSVYLMCAPRPIILKKVYFG
jgi:hypothetical protein